MEQPLDVDKLYLTWLYSQVGDTEIKKPTRTYWRMLEQLYNTKFVCVIPRDVNRIEDGKELRHEFVDQSGFSDVDHGWMEQSCSIFEILVELSRRLAFNAWGEAPDWFWEMIKNLGLQHCTDANDFSSHDVAYILDRFNKRRYKKNGEGGLFPLKYPQEDQRQVELWYQMSAYILERQN